MFGRLFVAVFAVFFVLLGFSGESWAKGETKYVNEAQIFKNSRAGKSLTVQVTARQQRLRARREKEEKSLSGERDNLLGQKEVLSEKAFEEKRAVFLEKVRGLQQSLVQQEEAARKDVERAYASMNAILGADFA